MLPGAKRRLMIAYSILQLIEMSSLRPSLRMAKCIFHSTCQRGSLVHKLYLSHTVCLVALFDFSTLRLSFYHPLSRSHFICNIFLFLTGFFVASLETSKLKNNFLQSGTYKHASIQDALTKLVRLDIFQRERAIHAHSKTLRCNNGDTFDVCVKL